MYTFSLLVLAALIVTGCAVPLSAPLSPSITATPPASAESVSPLPIPADPPAPLCSINAEEPESVTDLQDKYQLSDDLLLQWYCAGAGLGDIRKAYEVQARTGQPIEEIFEQFFAGVGWGDISRPDESQVVNPEEQLCIAEHGSHREVLRIGEEFNQPTEILSGLFCKGMGFGEIRQAIAIHQETGDPLQKIGALFLESRNWVTIRAELGASPLQGDPTGND